MYMCMCMEFTWTDPYDNLNIVHIADDPPISYVLEVHVEYPHHLHDFTAIFHFSRT